MKKILLLVILNIFIFLFLFVLVEIYCYWICSGKSFQKYNSFVFQTFEEAYKYVKENRMRKPVGLEYKKRPVLLFGCSFAYGYGLEEKDGFGTLLSKYMKRPVYNRAFEWLWGPQNMLYEARSEDLYKEVPNPEYIIYVFLYEHVNRAYSKYNYVYPFYPYLHYKLKNGKLVIDKGNPLDLMYITRLIGNQKIAAFAVEDKYKMTAEYFREAKEEFDKHWKDYKFIILVYSEYVNTDGLYAMENLRNEGFTIIETTDLVGRSMDQDGDTIEDKFHPSAEAWRLITPAFVNEINKL